MTQERLFPDVANQELAQAPPTRRATRPNEARLYRPVRNQVQMMLRDLDSLLPEDHLARAIWAFVERLDLSAFYAPIKAAAKQGLERLFAIELEYHVAMREAERAWVAALVRLIRTSPDFTRPWRTFHAQSGGNATAGEGIVGTGTKPGEVSPSAS